MFLAGTRSYFELNVLDYEHSSGSLQYNDRNLLLIGLRAGWHQNQTIITAPLLLTWEIELLITWLELIQQAQSHRPRLIFHEPCLAFECLSASTNEYLLQIQLAHEAAPDWHFEPAQPFWLPVLITVSQLSEAIHQLKGEATRFPVRP